MWTDAPGSCAAGVTASDTRRVSNATPAPDAPVGKYTVTVIGEPIQGANAVANIRTFHESIAKGDFSNPTVAESVRSNLVTVLGRTAAYEGRVVTWDELMKSEARLTPDLSGLKD